MNLLQAQDVMTKTKEYAQKLYLIADEYEKAIKYVILDENRKLTGGCKYAKKCAAYPQNDCDYNSKNCSLRSEFARVK